MKDLQFAELVAYKEALYNRLTRLTAFGGPSDSDKEEFENISKVHSLVTDEYKKRLQEFVIMFL